MINPEFLFVGCPRLLLCYSMIAVKLKMGKLVSSGNALQIRLSVYIDSRWGKVSLLSAIKLSQICIYDIVYYSKNFHLYDSRFVTIKNISREINIYFNFLFFFFLFFIF